MCISHLVLSIFIIILSTVVFVFMYINKLVLVMRGYLFFSSSGSLVIPFYNVIGDDYFGGCMANLVRVPFLYFVFQPVFLMLLNDTVS